MNEAFQESAELYALIARQLCDITTLAFFLVWFHTGRRWQRWRGKI